MPTIELQTSVEGIAAVVRCSGKLAAGVTDVFQAGVKPLLANYKRVVLDFTDVTYMDSMGLGTVIALYVSGKSSGCDVRLVNFSKRVRELLTIANVLSLFEAGGDQNNWIP
jgi:anti-sigma B factor antagonist